MKEHWGEEIKIEKLSVAKENVKRRLRRVLLSRLNTAAERERERCLSVTLL